MTSIDRSVLELAWLDALPAAPGASRLPEAGHWLVLLTALLLILGALAKAT